MSDLYELAEDCAWILPYLPDPIPRPWQLVVKESQPVDGAAFYRGRNKRDPAWRTVMFTGEIKNDGSKWLHVSIARNGELPTWQELVDVKEKFLGPECLALQVFPPRSRWISIHDYCLHLWHRLDGDPIPDLARGGNTI